MKIHTPYSCRQKPEIHYPCVWLYKVIGHEKEAIKEAFLHVCGGREAVFSFSNTSSGGKYHSYNIELTVDNEEDRLSLYNRLSNHPAIKVVI